MNQRDPGPPDAAEQRRRDEYARVTLVIAAAERQRWLEMLAMKPKKLSEAEIEAGRGPSGGWTREQFAAWGVPWPPPKGWRRALVEGREIPAGAPGVERRLQFLLDLEKRHG